MESYEERLEKNVVFLQKTVPPDDIYMFSELVFDAALYFLKLISENKEDFLNKYDNDDLFRKMARNTSTFYSARQENRDIFINFHQDLDMDFTEKDNNDTN